MPRNFGWQAPLFGDPNKQIPVFRAEPTPDEDNAGGANPGRVFVGTGRNRQQIFISDETRQQARRQNDRRGRTGLRGPGTL